MDFYLQVWSQKIRLSTGKTLADEYESVTKKVAYPENKELRKKLEVFVKTEQIPYDLQEENIRASLAIDPLVWDSLEPEKRGKIIAASVIRNQLEYIERFYSESESDRKNALQAIQNG